MEMFKVISFWLHAILVLLYGCWFVETKSEGHTRTNLTSKYTAFRHEMETQKYQESSTAVVYTLLGNDNHAPCVFPFIYLGKTYTECTYKDEEHSNPWCATTGNYDNDKKWGHCQTDNDVMDCMDTHKRCGNWARDGECVVNAPYMSSKCPRSCGFCTHGGNGQGRVCKFPFFYKDTFLYDCLQFTNKTWCATTTNYNKDNRWGYCFPKLYKDIKEVNKRFLRWGECDDQHEDCKTWVKNGMCEEQPTKMDSWCPWSCHKCAPELLVTHKGCKDHSPIL
ncbi:peptidase M10A [Desmophyllum pertusum]|uniref:Peptidase M10A n=1 Tax=Desmophyllum pertusum TaxID=174260 RepID=A0A9W9ZZU4_9CNID|nr:peptidase M10A [Desmophyllum pertusum]